MIAERKTADLCATGNVSFLGDADECHDRRCAGQQVP
jgi:hypothetical protein